MVPTIDPLARSLGIEAAPIPVLTDAEWSRMLQLASADPGHRTLDHLVPDSVAGFDERHAAGM